MKPVLSDSMSLSEIFIGTWMKQKTCVWHKIFSVLRV